MICVDRWKEKSLSIMKMRERSPLSASNRVLLFIFLAGHFAFCFCSRSNFTRIIYTVPVKVKQTNISAHSRVNEFREVL